MKNHFKLIAIIQMVLVAIVIVAIRWHGESKLKVSPQTNDQLIITAAFIGIVLMILVQIKLFGYKKFKEEVSRWET